ncbi:hypothetical protein ES705_09996 [subsurface metagenome]
MISVSKCGSRVAKSVNALNRAGMGNPRYCLLAVTAPGADGDLAGSTPVTGK